MTLVSRLGYTPTTKDAIAVPRLIHPSDMTVIVPVKNNQAGIDRLLDQFEKLAVDYTPPAEIIIVDNCSEPPVAIEGLYSCNVTLITCERLGPAAARNEGAKEAGSNWLLFIDSDCIPTASTMDGYRTNNNTHVAYAGNIKIESSDLLSRYYASQETLIPPKAIDCQKSRPEYLVTANCLVSRAAFEKVGGFDETFLQAGGEDIDLGFQLLRTGSLGYQWKSIVMHSFDDGLFGFWKRFHRYGLGNRMLAEKYQLNLKPRPFVPNSLCLANVFLALMQYLAMSMGYRKP